MKKRLISVLCALVLVVACLLTALATRADAKSAGAIRSDKETGVTVYQDTTGGIVLSNLPVPQRMMPGSVIIYDDQLQAKVIQGGYVKDGSTPILDTRTTIMRGLEAVTITADMSPDERATAEWENRLVNDFKTQILKNGIQATQPYSPTIYPGMKVVYNESDGYIDNVYYPDATEPSGYSIHNVPVNNSDSTATMLAATPVLGQPYGAHSNVINFQYADDSFLGVGRATYFTGTTGNRGNTLRNYDCATQIDLDYSKVGDKNVTIRNLNTNQVFTFHQADVGGLPDAVIDIWGLSNLQTLAGNPTPGVLSVCPVRYYHKRFSDQQVP
ncbi:MAG: hypothetical protein ACPL2N_06080 [Candidatus Cryosericum sp.]